MSHPDTFDPHITEPEHPVTPYHFERWQEGIYRRDARRAYTRDETGAHTGIPNPDSRGDPERPIPDERRAYMLSSLVYPSQLDVTHVAKDLQTQEFWLRIVDGRGLSTWIPKEVAASHLRLSQESKHGFNFPAHDSAKIVDLLLKSSELRTVALMSSRQGAVKTDQGWGWLLGNEWIGPPGSLVHPSPNPSQYARAIGVAGRIADWKRALVELIQHAGVVARWLTFGSFAAPLLRWVNYRTFVIHHYGMTAGGKSAMQDFGASVWGRPKDFDGSPKLAGTFNATTNALIEQFRFVDDLPVMTDELQAAGFKDSSKQVIDLIMQIVMGQSRQRLTQTGELRAKTAYWRSVVRFNGEQPLIGNQNYNLGGAENRIVQIRADAMRGKDAKRLHQWMERNQCYGVAGRAFLQALLPVVNDETRLVRLRETTLGVHDEIEYRAGSDDRRLAHLAVIAVAQAIASRMLFGTEFARARERAIEDALEIAQLADLGELEPYQDRAWDFLDQHLAADPSRYLDLAEEAHAARLESGEYRDIIGVVNANNQERRWYIPSKVNDLLARGGFHPGRFWDDARLAGQILTTEEGRNLTPHRSCGKFRARVYVVTR